MKTADEVGARMLDALRGVLDLLALAVVVLLLALILLATAYEISKTLVELSRRLMARIGVADWWARLAFPASFRGPMRRFWGVLLVLLFFGPLGIIAIKALPPDILSPWAGTVPHPQLVGYVLMGLWTAFILWGIAWGVVDGMKPTSLMRSGEAPVEPPALQDTSKSGHDLAGGVGDQAASTGRGPLAPRRLRWILAALFFFVLSLMVLTLIPREEGELRAASIVAGGGVSLIVGLRLRTRVQVATEPEPPLPTGLEDRVAALVSHAVEHADRSAVAWATITVTAHSVMAIALSKLDRPQELAETARTMTIYAAALLVLASITLPGAHSVSMSAARARRAIDVARKDPAIGLLYGRVYQDGPPVWQADLLGITMNAFGKIWLWVGFLLLALGAIYTVI